MARHLPILTAVLAGTGLLGGSAALAIAAVTVAVVLFVALRYGRAIEAFIGSPSQEVLLLKVLGLTVLMAGGSPNNCRSPPRSKRFWPASPCPGHPPTLRACCSPPCGICSALYSSSSWAYEPTRPPSPCRRRRFPARRGRRHQIHHRMAGARRAGIGRTGRERSGAVLIPRGVQHRHRRPRRRRPRRPRPTGRRIRSHPGRHGTLSRPRRRTAAETPPYANRHLADTRRALQPPLGHPLAPAERRRNPC